MSEDIEEVPGTVTELELLRYDIFNEIDDTQNNNKNNNNNSKQIDDSTKWSSNILSNDEQYEQQQNQNLQGYYDLFEENQNQKIIIRVQNLDPPEQTQNKTWRLYASRKDHEINQLKFNKFSSTFAKLAQKTVKRTPLLRYFGWSSRGLNRDIIKKTLIIYSSDNQATRDLKLQVILELYEVLMEHKEELITQKEKYCNHCKEVFGEELAKSIKIISKNPVLYEWYYERSWLKLLQILEEYDNINEKHFKHLTKVKDFRKRPDYVSYQEHNIIECENNRNSVKKVYHDKEIYESVKAQFLFQQQLQQLQQ